MGEQVPVVVKVDQPVPTYIEKLVYRSPPRVVGLGIKVRKDPGAAGSWVVERLVPGFAAHKSGLVRTGDTMMSLDRRGLSDLTEDEIAKNMCGPEGSACLLSLVRRQADGSSKTVSVRLYRVDPCASLLDEEERNLLEVRGSILFTELMNKAAMRQVSLAFDTWAEQLPRWNYVEAVVVVSNDPTAADVDFFALQKELRSELATAIGVLEDQVTVSSVAWARSYDNSAPGAVPSSAWSSRAYLASFEVRANREQVASDLIAYLTRQLDSAYSPIRRCRRLQHASRIAVRPPPDHPDAAAFNSSLDLIPTATAPVLPLRAVSAAPPDHLHSRTPPHSVSAGSASRPVTPPPPEFRVAAGRSEPPMAATSAVGGPAVGVNGFSMGRAFDFFNPVVK